MCTAEQRIKTRLWYATAFWRGVAERSDMKYSLTVYRCYVSGTDVQLMNISLQDRPWTRQKEIECSHHNWLVMESCGRVKGNKCGGLEERDTAFTDPFSLLFVIGLFAVHGNIRATRETSGIYMKRRKFMEQI